ncbi:MAG TPA: hypothetical protein VG711_08610 [Phycisphaerales bacterium]|nr:hypothetical protein [Phycisphaerales bacterium]
MFRNLINAPLVLSVVAIGAVGMYAIVQFPSLVQSAFVGGSGDDSLQAAREITQKKHELLRTQDVTTIVNRSPFATPLPTPVYVPPPPPPPQPKPDDKPKPQPFIDHYTGPSPIGIYGSTVPFKRPDSNNPPFVLNVGETNHGVTLLATNPPWSVHVKYQGHEFDVDVIKSVAFLDKLTTTRSRPTTDLPIQDVKEAPPQPDAGSTSESRAAAANGDESESADDDHAASGPGESESDDEAAPKDEGEHDESDKVQTAAQPGHPVSGRRLPRTY